MTEHRESVAVIVVNHRERTLPACLESVYAQTHRPAEIVVVDEASEDGSRAIAREFRDASEGELAGIPVTVVELPGRGAAAARDAGVAASRAPLLFFVDSGTVLAPDAVEVALRTMREAPGCGVVEGTCHPEPLYDDGPVERYRVALEHFTRRRAAAPRFSCTLVPRPIYVEAGGLDEQRADGEDADFSGRLLAEHKLLATRTVVCRIGDTDRLLPFLRSTFRGARVTVLARRRGGPARTRRAATSPPRARYLDSLAKLSTGLFLLSLLVLPLAPTVAWLLAVPPPLAATVVVASHEFLRFGYRLRGARFAVFAAGMHLLWHIAAVLGAGAGVLLGAGRAGARRRRAALRALGVVFGAGLVVALGSVLVRQDWTVVTTAIAEQDRVRFWSLLGGSVLAASVGLVPGIVSWRAVLLDLGPPVRTIHVVRIFLVSFLARYLPRGLGVVATVPAAKAAGVGLGRLVSAMALNLVVVIMTGLTVGLAAGLDLFGAQGAWLLLAPLLTVALLLRPALVNHGAKLLAKLFRRPPPTGVVSARGIRSAVAAQTLSWLISGLHLWLLAIMVGAPVAKSLPLCVGAFSLAMVVGMLAFVVPDGIGVRESILTGALAVVLPLPSAVAVTLASRLVTTLTDAMVGTPALAVAEIAYRRERRRGGAGRSGQPRPPVRPVQTAPTEDQVRSGGSVQY